MPEPTTAAPAPIFIVGSPRSGTTLLAAILGAHPDLDCGPETRFFPWLADRDRTALLDPAGWPDAAAAFVCSLALRDAPVHALFGVSPAEVRAWLAARPPSVAAMLEALTVQRMRAHGKTRWAEKTPRHLEALAEIRRTWPDAAIVRVVRDPRDVALSTVKVPFARDSATVVLGTIARDEARADRFCDADAGTCTIRYEDLLTDPEGTLRAVCATTGLAWDPALLDRRAAVADLAAPHETWKQKAAEPLDPSRIGVWRTEMDPAVARFAALHLRAHLRRYGYDGAEDPVGHVALVPVGRLAAVRSEPLVLALAGAGFDIDEPVPLAPVEIARREVCILWGQAAQLELDLGRGATTRTRALARLALDLLARRLRGRPALWVRRNTPRPLRRGDRGLAAAGILLRLLARTTRPAEIPVALGIGGALAGSADE
ncbi:MAG: sulfotransferase family protein [Chloroflexota bacterium]